MLMEYGINRKLRILWFSNTDAGYSSRGVKGKQLSGTWMQALVSAFKKEKIEFELGVVFKSNEVLPNKKIEGVSYFPIFNTNNNRFKRLIQRINRKIIYYEYIDKYLKVVNDFRPNIIHVFGSEQDFGLIVKFVEIPVVLSIQGNLTVCDWKYFSGISKLQSILYEDIYKNLLFSGMYNSYKIFNKRAKREIKILHSLNYIIGRTDWDRRIASILAPNAKYFYNDELLREKFYTAEILKPKLNGKVILTTVTRPALYKGLEVVYKAAKLLSDLNVDYEWNIIGVTKSNSILRIVRKMLKEEFYNTKIKLWGGLNENEILDVLSETNIYIMPSHIENSSITLSEAMILGLPTISTLAGGTSSRLENGKEGLIIQNGDPWSMAGAIIELINNYDIAVEYGKKARERARERHNPSKVIKDLLNIYMEIDRRENK